MADPLATYKQIRNSRGDDAAQEYLDSNPAAMQAYMRHYAPRYATV